MKTLNILSRFGTYMLLLVLTMPLLIGCGVPVAADTSAGDASYSGALDDSYEGALGATDQLALGTLQLEGTANAVTEAQALALLPLWQALGGEGLQGEAEQYAVLRQIEAAMTEAQMSAIAGSRLTVRDAQDQIGTQGIAVSDASGRASGSGQMPAGMPEDVSEEQIAQMRAQFSGLTSSGLGFSQALTREVIELLTVRSGVPDESVTQPSVVQDAGQATDRESTGAPNTPEAAEASGASETPATTMSPGTAEPSAETESFATGEGTAAAESPAAAELPAAELEGAQEAEPSTPESAESVIYVVQAGNSLATIAAAYDVTIEEIAEANGIEDPNTIYAGQELVIVEPGRIPEPAALAPSAQAQSEPETVAAVPPVQALEWLPDNDPAPPLTIEVSANRATQDPLVEQSQTYLVTGIVRNDGDRTYAVSDILVTFYDAEGFRGTFDPAFRDGKLVGGEWNWHGQTEAEFAALLLAPGEEWPFRVEITAQDMASFLIHPDAAPTGRESAPVELSDVRVVDDGTGYVRISGTATNVHAFVIKNVTVSGVLLDGSGQIVSLGSAYVLQEEIESGKSVHFDVRVEKEPYANYQLYAQAERAW